MNRSQKVHWTFDLPEQSFCSKYKVMFRSVCKAHSRYKYKGSWKSKHVASVTEEIYHYSIFVESLKEAAEKLRKESSEIEVEEVT